MVVYGRVACWATAHRLLLIEGTLANCLHALAKELCWEGYPFHKFVEVGPQITLVGLGRLKRQIDEADKGRT